MQLTTNKNKQATTSYRQGFALVEITLLVLVIGILVVGIYFVIGESTSIPSITTSPTTSQPTPVGIKYKPTIYPTQTPLTTNSSDGVLNQTADELNTLNNELNALDQIEFDLNLPEVDFSMDEL